MTSTTDLHDDRDFKDGIRSEWSAAAAGWAKWLATTEAPEAGVALTQVLLAEAAVGPGDTVIDLGAGYGEPGLSAAAVVGPTGSVTCVDIAGDMLAFAEQRARAASLTNVSFVEADIDRFDPGAGTCDVVLSRAALMYAIDPLAVLRRAREALRPGGRLAVAVWGPAEQVAFAVPFGVIGQLLNLAPPPDGPGPFALAGAGVLDGLVRAAGFADARSGTTTVVYEAATAAACTEWIRDVAPPITELLAGQPDDVQHHLWAAVTDAWAPFQASDGSVRLPCTAIWTAGAR